MCSFAFTMSLVFIFYELTSKAEKGIVLWSSFWENTYIPQIWLSNNFHTVSFNARKKIKSNQNKRKQNHKTFNSYPQFIGL